MDYRIPVFRELSHLVNGELYLIYSGDYVPESVQLKAKEALGEHCIPLSGEWKVGSEDRDFMANKNVSIRFQPGLLKKIKEIHPDVLICDGFFKWTFPVLVYKFFYRVPIVINYERTFHTERNAQWFRTLYRKLVVKFADAMDCSGQLCVEYAKSLGMPKRNITTGHMSADTEGMSEMVASVTQKEIASLREELSASGMIFIYVGRLHPLKGVAELVNAWSEFEGINPGEATLVLVGNGEQREDLEKLCQKKGIKSVRFIGQVPYDEIAVYYAMSDVFIIPTLEDNWSLVVPEAMVAGLPIICSKYNGCWPDLISEGQNGWVFDPLDPEALMDTLERAHCSRHEFGAMGLISKQIIRGFGPAHAAQSILDACHLAGR